VFRTRFAADQRRRPPGDADRTVRHSHDIVAV
jgi:hypothetical protein